MQGWHFTGVYVPCDQSVTLWTLGGDCGDALTYRIGAWLDSTCTRSKDNPWHRFPFSSAAGPLAGETCQQGHTITARVGGLLYIVVSRTSAHNPNRARPHPQHTRVTIRGGMPAPPITCNTSTESIADRMLYSPWGEISGDFFALTLPQWAIAVQ